MSKDKNTSVIDTKPAEKAVADLEAIPPGESWADAASAARAAVGELHQEAAAVVFPVAPIPVGSDTWADVDAYLELCTRNTYGDDIARVHGDALTLHPALAAALRSSVILGRVSAMAAGTADVHARDRAEHATGELRRYQRLVARQLVEAGEHTEAAEILATVVPDLDQRVDAAVAAHEEHAREELERIEREEREAAAELLTLEQARVDDLAARLERVPGSASIDVLDGRRAPTSTNVTALRQRLAAGLYRDQLDAIERQLVGLEAARDFEPTRPAA